VPLQPQPQPFSVALRQLEAALTEQVLPADVLENNRKHMATLKQFAASLSQPAGYPPATIKTVQFVFRCVVVKVGEELREVGAGEWGWMLRWSGVDAGIGHECAALPDRQAGGRAG